MKKLILAVLTAFVLSSFSIAEAAPRSTGAKSMSKVEKKAAKHASKQAEKSDKRAAKKHSKKAAKRQEAA